VQERDEQGDGVQNEIAERAAEKPKDNIHQYHHQCPHM